MRDIKFRAWDRFMEEMFVVKAINFQTKEVWSGHVEGTEQAWQELESVDLMQYTGLLDKNKVGIYEGDVLKSRWEEVFEVVYRRCWFQLEQKNLSRTEWELLGNYLGGNLEVIGNIHENPELLDQATP